MAKVAEFDRLLANERKEQPELSYAAQRCVQAWNDLSTCRSVGMSMGPIPITAIWAWCDRQELDAEAAAIVEHVIRRLDIGHAEAAAAKREVTDATGPARAKGRTR